MALYLRLSLEDEKDREEQKSGSSGGERDESNSISSQRKQIYEYIRHDFELSRYEAMEFCDDGYSGTNMNRPGMQKLLQEIRAHRIQCVIVKDMSRFSRDYIEMGTYLNRIFPFMGIRFIAINDHYDSSAHDGSAIELDTAFQTLLYDLYSKDVSVKVKAAFENKCANGEYIFGQAPFGYAKSKEVKNTVIVNEKEAEIVRCIFSLAAQGKTAAQIAKQLYAENVPAIMQMRNPEKNYTDGKAHAWSGNAVRRILNNRFYLGEMAYGKSVRKSVGSKHSIAVPREDWKVIRDHHEAIISEEIYERAVLFRPGKPVNRQRSAKQENAAFQSDSKKQHLEKHPLTGRLYCGGCGYALSYKPLCGKNRYRRFECRKHALLQKPECCTYMRADRLEETVLMMLNRELMLWGNVIKQQEKLSTFQKAGILSFKRKLKEYGQELKRVQAKKDTLYERYALGELAREEYQIGAGELAEQLSSLSEKKAEAEMKLAEWESADRENADRKTAGDMQQMLRYLHVTELTKEIVDRFIRRVYAYQDKRIEIEWNFVPIKRV